jgi:plasmid stabilization system protein ParE
MKDYTVLWLETAKENYREIVQSLKLKMSAEAARKIFTQLVQDINRLAQFPNSNPLVRHEEFRDQGVRMLISGEYLCFYIVEESVVEIHHIVHRKRDYCKLFTFHPGGK